MDHALFSLLYSCSCTYICCCAMSVCHVWWCTDVSNVVFLALLLQTSLSCWGSVWPMEVVMLGPVYCPKRSLLPSHMGAHKVIYLYTLASVCTRYTIHRCTYGKLNRHTRTRRRTHKCAHLLYASMQTHNANRTLGHTLHPIWTLMAICLTVYVPGAARWISSPSFPIGL